MNKYKYWEKDVPLAKTDVLWKLEVFWKRMQIRNLQSRSVRWSSIYIALFPKKAKKQEDNYFTN